MSSSMREAGLGAGSSVGSIRDKMESDLHDAVRIRQQPVELHTRRTMFDFKSSVWAKASAKVRLTT